MSSDASNNAKGARRCGPRRSPRSARCAQRRRGHETGSSRPSGAGGLSRRPPQGVEECIGAQPWRPAFDRWRRRCVCGNRGPDGALGPGSRPACPRSSNGRVPRTPDRGSGWRRWGSPAGALARCCTALRDRLLPSGCARNHEKGGDTGDVAAASRSRESAVSRVLFGRRSVEAPPGQPSISDRRRRLSPAAYPGTTRAT